MCDAVICTIDLLKKDSEIKILIGCTDEEKDVIMRFHNDSEYMKGVMIRRESEAKIWLHIEKQNRKIFTLLLSLRCEFLWNLRHQTMSYDEYLWFIEQMRKEFEAWIGCRISLSSFNEYSAVS